MYDKNEHRHFSMAVLEGRHSFWKENRPINGDSVRGLGHRALPNGGQARTVQLFQTKDITTNSSITIFL